MLCDRDPDNASRLQDAKDYILHKGRRQLLTANWKTADPGVVVYTAGTLDVHMRDTYHNAYHISKRASRKENMYSHLRKEDKMRVRNRYIRTPSGAEARLESGRRGATRIGAPVRFPKRRPTRPPRFTAEACVALP